MENTQGVFSLFTRSDVIWFFIGQILLFIEFMAPGILFLFFTIGAWAVVVLSLIFH